MVDEMHRVLGYYALSAYGVRLTDLPASLARKLPRYPLIPATLLAGWPSAATIKDRSWDGCC